MCPTASVILVAVSSAGGYRTGVLFLAALAVAILKTWHESSRRARQLAAPAEPSEHVCPSCGSSWTIPVRRKTGRHLDASYFVCTACHKRSGDGVWSDAPVPEELRGDKSGTLGRLLSVKDRVSPPRPVEPTEDVSGLIDEIRRRDQRPHRVNLSVRDRPPLWDDWLDGGP